MASARIAWGHGFSGVKASACSGQRQLQYLPVDKTNPAWPPRRGPRTCQFFIDKQGSREKRWRIWCTASSKPE